MAQALAEPGDTRHGFRQFSTINHDFNRITSMSVTKNGNVLLCDYNKKQIDLVDADGGFLNKIPLTGNPYDVTVTTGNIAFVTMPNDGYVLQLDPDRLVIIKKFKSGDGAPDQIVRCLSAVKSDEGKCAFNISSTLNFFSKTHM